MDRAESTAYTLHAALSRRIRIGQRAATASRGRTGAEAQYLIPLAFRKRALFKMDLAEVVYITELRTSPAGHWSYRNVAWQMYLAVANQHPSLARYFRVHDVREPVDLLEEKKQAARIAVCPETGPARQLPGLSIRKRLFSLSCYRPPVRRRRVL